MNIPVAVRPGATHTGPFPSGNLGLKWLFEPIPFYNSAEVTLLATEIHNRAVERLSLKSLRFRAFP
jgi:hypothetical protein